jgi:hypothetical protein
MPMTSRDEYVTQLKTELDRRNAEIRRREATTRDPTGAELEALREQRRRALSKLRLLR